MGKAKFRVSNAYRGRRRRSYRKSTLSNLLETAQVPNQIAGPNPSSQASDRPHTSTSAKKLDFFGISLDVKEECESFDDDCYFIVQKSSMCKLIATVLCPKCFSSGLRFVVTDNNACGFAVKCVVICDTCEDVIIEQYMCERIGSVATSRAPFEINTRAVVAFRGIGCGQSAMQSWCGTMNMPNCLSHTAYQTVQSKLNVATKETFLEVSKTVQQAIVKSYEEVGIKPDCEGILEIGVSYDGSWHKRGHSSHTGIGVVIDLLTGLPIDYEVLSNFCLQCQLAPSSEDENLHDWLQKHSEHCSKNYAGSANSMELECARRIWERSEQKHKLRYTTILSDGDSKTYDNLLQKKVYGDAIQINKEECVNHVAKRMGTALNNLVAQSKAQKITISGRGKLTKDKIIKIQNYYGRAIKDNASDVPLMKKRIFAILYHLSSTDEMPKHVHCPPGEKLWCFWQRALAKGESPSKHKDHETLPPEIGTKMVPIFQRLTEEKLLSRCSSNRTQNNNESLHNLIWSFCPKRIFAGRTTVENAVCMAILQFSMGSTFKEVLCKVLGFAPGRHLQDFSRKKDQKRLLKSDKASCKDTKKKRKQRKYQKSKVEQKNIVKEGETYKAGSFE